ncbi:DUF4157 domain-containing protein [Streptomyces sp. NPDC012421]|uniref:eCIS core domain-containing protein n=1 Tax=Streptomyces sp. NPDC012421 TaxID=3364832 RepID=UPI0036E78CE2
MGRVPTRSPSDGPARTGVTAPGDAFERRADAVAARVVAAAPPGRAPVPSGSGHDGGIPPAVRARIEPRLGTDLGGVRVRTGPGAAAAAAALGARAFTSRADIFLGRGESPYDVRLMAHEAAHVVQQRTLPGARCLLMRQPAKDGGVPLPSFLGSLAAPVRALPGYGLLTLITGKDLLSGTPVAVDRGELVVQVLTSGPFGPVVGEVLKAAGIIGDVFSLLADGLARNDLTFARLVRELEHAWAEIHVAEGVDAGLRVVRRHVDAVLSDVRAFVRQIAARVVELIRTAAAGLVEPLLETPKFKPVWELAKKVLHYDPLRDRPVEAPTVEILEDFLRLIGQESALAQMKERGTLQKTADWLDGQAARFTGILAALRGLFRDAWAAIQPQNLPDLLTNLKDLAGRAFALADQVGEFATTVVGTVLSLIKDALLGWLSQYAHKIPGFHLLTVILGRNPFTGEAVERNAQNLIKGFVTLLPDGEATYEQLAATGVVAEAAARIEGELARLGISSELVTSTFRGVWDTLRLQDLLDPVGAFLRVTERFGEPLGRIVEFAGVVVEVVVGLVLKLMNFPTDLLERILANVKRAVADIRRDPVAFLLHMLEALKAGFVRFFDHIGTYLLQGLVKWLFRGLGKLGIALPTELTLPSLLGLVLDVLGVGVETLWQKLGKHIGPERAAALRGAVDTLGGAWAFIADVHKRGAPAVADFLAERLSGLWDAVLGMARDWIMKEIVEGVVAKLISMLDPTGVMAVVNSFIAFFRAVQSAIEYLREILEIVDGYVTTFAEVAAGRVEPGAAMIEKGLADAVPVAIGFLASQVGIGNVPEAIVGIIKQVRRLVDEALEWLFTQAMRLGAPALRALGVGPPAGAGAAPGAGGKEAVDAPFTVAGENHHLYTDPTGELLVASGNPKRVKDIARLKELHGRYAALPEDAGKTARNRIVAEMIDVVRSDPHVLAELLGSAKTAMDPPNLGDVGRHARQSRRFQPRSGGVSYAALWELESEHVIPRSYVDSLLLSQKWAPCTASEYGAMHTVLIYKGAADLKTDDPRGDQANLRRFAQAVRERAEARTGTSGQAKPKARRVSAGDPELAGRAFDKLVHGAVRRTLQAVDDDYAARREQRMTAAAKPSEATILKAVTRQYEDIEAIVERRVAAE